MKKFFSAIYSDRRFFLALGGIIFLFVLGNFYAVLYFAAKISFIALCFLSAIDLFLLFRTREGVRARRMAPEKLSNGDDNEIQISVENLYPFRISATIIDELPFQFQARRDSYTVDLAEGEEHLFAYSVRPVKRGEYSFGAVNVYAITPIGLFQRRKIFDQGKVVPVYPSYLQLRKYELMAISNRLVDYGIKRIRKVGRTMEFDQVREYVQGDDYRTLNWTATARKNKLMVNQYQDEKSQQVYCVIDKGRTMKMPFDGLSLLDYAINASLVLSNVAIQKDDRAGLMTFSHYMGTVLPAEKRRSQMQKILEILYNQKTQYLESNFEALYASIRKNISHYSLIVLFTNFESQQALERQLPYLRKIARHHLLVVIFFENTELRHLTETSAETVEQVYIKTIAEKFSFEKKMIAKELERYGIQSVFTAPENLTINAINKYLELKARRMI